MEEWGCRCAGSQRDDSRGRSPFSSPVWPYGRGRWRVGTNPFLSLNRDTFAHWLFLSMAIFLWPSTLPTTGCRFTA